ncbi:MAG: helix-turn-helix domain-containing protein [Clostridia bacterium]|nr:helix-turn-helix domain-containing protein [Clostridia bacterium]
MRELAIRLKELRTEKNVSLMTLAKAIGVSDVAVMKWERDISEPTASNIKNLAVYFDVSSDYLLGIENYDYTKNT